MKTNIMLNNLNSQEDVRKIQSILSNEEGILACEIKKSSKSVVVIHDEVYIKSEDIVDILENLGYYTI